MKRYLSSTAAALAFAATFVATASAQDAPAPPAVEPGASLLAMANLPAKTPAKLVVLSPAFKAGADIPFENTQYKGNIFPGLSWTAGPKETKSYAIIMQDGDAIRQGAPILHWTMVNIPATATKLDAAMTTLPAGSANGPNIRGPGQAYMGPRTPAGPKHRYHVQVFALDTTLPADAANYAALTAAMKDHVLASGELIGLGRAMPSGQ